MYGVFIYNYGVSIWNNPLGVSGLVRSDLLKGLQCSGSKLNFQKATESNPKRPYMQWQETLSG